jgi:glycosyltransferase involved in cell wall biosynthesis
VASILEQTYREYQLVILDNASSDGTTQWVSSLNEPRVALMKSNKPLDIQESWQRIFQYVPKNEFMTFIGHDDVWDRNYLETVSRLIEKHPDAGLYQTHFRLIDVAGNVLRPCRPMPEHETSAEFLESRMVFKRDSYGTGYMFRSSDYERVGGIPSYDKLLFADDALWISLMQGSWKATSKATCFAYRVHSTSTSFSPGPVSLYAALDAYLEFLKEKSLTDADILDVLRRRLPNYLIKLYQSGYFPLKEDREQFRVLGKTIKSRIEWSAQKAAQILDTPDAKATTHFSELTHRRVFRSRSYYYWYARVRLHNLRLKVMEALNA